MGMKVDEIICVLNTMRLGSCQTEKEAIDGAVEILEDFVDKDKPRKKLADPFWEGMYEDDLK